MGREISYASILLSAERALIAEMAECFRAIFVQWDEKKILLTFIYDGEITEEDLESASCIETEMIADFFDWRQLNYRCIRLDYPETIPKSLGHCFYLRRKDRFNKQPDLQYDTISHLDCTQSELESLFHSIKEPLNLLGNEKDPVSRYLVDFERQIGFYREKDSGVILPTSCAIVQFSPHSEHSTYYFVPTQPNNYEKKDASYALVRLVARSALIGEISSRTRAITLDENDDKIEIGLIYEQEIQTEDKESAARIKTNLLSDFYGIRNIQVKNIRVDAPDRIPNNLGPCIYLRRKDLKYW